jgi:hypothetical protein
MHRKTFLVTYALKFVEDGLLHHHHHFLSDRITGETRKRRPQPHRNACTPAKFKPLEFHEIRAAGDNRDDAEMTADAEEVVSEALRDLARWLYDCLEREYDYLQSDEMVDEATIANGYTFTASGERFG